MNFFRMNFFKWIFKKWIFKNKFLKIFWIIFLKEIFFYKFFFLKMILNFHSDLNFKWKIKCWKEKNPVERMRQSKNSTIPSSVAVYMVVVVWVRDIFRTLLAPAPSIALDALTVRKSRTVMALILYLFAEVGSILSRSTLEMTSSRTVSGKSNGAGGRCNDAVFSDQQPWRVLHQWRVEVQRGRHGQVCHVSEFGGLDGDWSGQISPISFSHW